VALVTSAAVRQIHLAGHANSTRVTRKVLIVKSIVLFSALSLRPLRLCGELTNLTTEAQRTQRQRREESS